MTIRLILALPCLLLLAALAYAGSPCSDCFRSAEEALKSCLDSAISVDDKTTCEDRRDEQLKTCSDGECRVEREKREQKTEAPPQTP